MLKCSRQEGGAGTGIRELGQAGKTRQDLAGLIGSLDFTLSGKRGIPPLLQFERRRRDIGE